MKRFAARYVIAATFVVIFVWGMAEFDNRIKFYQLERKRHFVAIRFAIEKFSNAYERVPNSLDEVFPASYIEMIAPFGGNLSYSKISEDRYILEEIHERKVSLCRSDRLKTSNDLTIDPNPDQWSKKP